MKKIQVKLSSGNLAHGGLSVVANENLHTEPDLTATFHS